MGFCQYGRQKNCMIREKRRRMSIARRPCPAYNAPQAGGPEGDYFPSSAGLPPLEKGARQWYTFLIS